MRRVYTFKCPQCEEVFDEFTEYTDSHECPQCGSVAGRIVTAPQIKLEGLSGAFPTAYDAWEKKRAQKLAQERKYAD